MTYLTPEACSNLEKWEKARFSRYIEGPRCGPPLIEQLRSYLIDGDLAQAIHFASEGEFAADILLNEVTIQEQERNLRALGLLEPEGVAYICKEMEWHCFGDWCLVAKYLSCLQGKHAAATLAVMMTKKEWRQGESTRPLDVVNILADMRKEKQKEILSHLVDDHVALLLLTPRGPAVGNRNGSAAQAAELVVLLGGKRASVVLLSLDERFAACILTQIAQVAPQDAATIFTYLSEDTAAEIATYMPEDVVASIYSIMSGQQVH